jgi:hypothetical protein
VRALQTRVQKLERGKAGDGNAQPFYILWVPAGADRVAAADLESSGFSSSSSASDDVRDQQFMCEMTNRELIGAILTSKDMDDAVVRA